MAKELPIIKRKASRIFHLMLAQGSSFVLVREMVTNSPFGND